MYMYIYMCMYMQIHHSIVHAFIHVHGQWNVTHEHMMTIHTYTSCTCTMVQFAKVFAIQDILSEIGRCLRWNSSWEEISQLNENNDSRSDWS